MSEYTKMAQIKLLREIAENTRKTRTNSWVVKWILLIPILFGLLIFLLSTLFGIALLSIL